MDAYIGGACSTSGAPVAGDIAVRLDQVQAAIDDVREALSPGGSASAVAARNALRSSGGSSDPRSPHNFPSPPGGGAPYVSRRGSGSGSAGSVSPGGRMSAIVPYGAPEGLGSERARVPAQPGRRQLEPPPVGPAAGHRRSRRQLHRGEPGRAAAGRTPTAPTRRVGGAEAAGVSHLP